MKVKLKYSYFFNLKTGEICRFERNWIYKGVDHFGYYLNNKRVPYCFIGKTDTVCAREDDFYQPWEFEKPVINWDDRGDAAPVVVGPNMRVAKKILAAFGL